jgi:cytochrome c-type biogenesis protein
LTSILALAGSEATLGSGAALLLIYSLGLGVPFVVAAAFLDRFRTVSAWLRARAATVDAIAGVLLIAMGLLIFSGQLQSFMAPALELYSRLHWPPI